MQLQTLGQTQHHYAMDSMNLSPPVVGMGLLHPPHLVIDWGRLTASAPCAVALGGGTLPLLVDSAAMIGSAVIPQGHPRFPGVHHRW